jgi:isocitrate dehydrogenase
MYNLDDSIRDFARASFNYGLNRWPVTLDQEHDPQAYDGRFKDLLQEVFEAGVPAVRGRSSTSTA